MDIERLRDYMNRNSVAVTSLGILAVSFLFYLYTLSPSIGWEDAPKFPREAYQREFNSLPWSHPAYLLTGHLFTRIPVGDLAYRINLVSAVFGSLALFTVFHLLLLMFTLYEKTTQHRKLLAAAGAVLSLMVSRTFWFHSVTAEVYIMLSFFIAAIVYCFVRYDLKEDNRWLYLGLFLYGLSVAVHMMTAFALPGMVVFAITMAIRRKRALLNVRTIAFAALFSLLGLSLYLFLAVRDVLFMHFALNIDLADAVDLLGGGPVKSRFFEADYPLWYSPLQALGFHLYDFIGPAVLLGGLGLVLFLFSRMRRFVYIFAFYVGFMFFAIGFCVEDQNTFFLPVLTLFSLFIGFGILKLLQPLRAGRPAMLAGVLLLTVLPLIPAVLYASIPGWIVTHRHRPLLERWVVFNYGQRGEWELQAMWADGRFDRIRLYEHYLNPNQRYDNIGREYGEAMLDSLPPDAVFITGGIWDWYTMSVLRYLQELEAQRPDVKHIHWQLTGDLHGYEQRLAHTLGENVAENAVYVSMPFYRIMQPLIETWYTFEQEGMVYRVRGTWQQQR